MPQIDEYKGARITVVNDGKRCFIRASAC